MLTSTKKRALVFEALAMSVTVRKKFGVDKKSPFCLFDKISGLNIDLRFEKISSLEGMYLQTSPPTIIISSLRSYGRKIFTCAHELGHFVFNHGEQIDTITYFQEEQMFNEKELLVDMFASFLLMPESLVKHAIKKRNINLQMLNSWEAYQISRWIGISYQAFIFHISKNLNLISELKYQELNKETPIKIKKRILDSSINTEVVPVDENWTDRSIDVEIGDLILTPSHIICEGNSIKPVNNKNKIKLFEGINPGICRLYSLNSNWASFVRVSRRNYSGLSMFRHEVE